MTEFRATDKHGVIVGLQELGETDSAIQWAIAVSRNGAVKIEKKVAGEWVLFEHYLGASDASGD